MMDEEKKFSYTLNLKLKKEEKFFGPGVLELLRRIADTGSMNTAAKGMKMSYSKAWRIINKAEQDLGYSLIIKSVGGSDGGGSVLTEEAEKLIDKFLLFERKVYDKADQYFEEIFGDHWNKGE